MFSGFLLSTMAATTSSLDTTAQNVLAPVTAEVQNIELTAAQLFAAADSLAKASEFDEAIALLTALTTNPNPEFRAEARVRIARIYIAKGDLRTATLWYQKLLDEKPNAASVRVELANALAQLGDEAAAGRQIRRAAAVPGLPENVLRALGRINANFRNNAPFGGSFQLGIAPDTNINSATNAQQVNIFGLPATLSDDGRSQSGTGATINASIFSRRKIDTDSRLIAQLFVNADLYRQSSFNDINVNASVGVEIKSKNALFRPTVIAGRRFFGQNPLYDLVGISTAIEKPVSSTSQITVTASAFNFKYATRSDLSGPVYSLGLVYDSAITTRLSAQIELTVARTDANDPVNATNIYGSSIVLSRDAGRFTLFGKIGYRKTDGDAPFAVFGAARRDNQLTFEAGMVFRQISFLGLSPLVKVQRTENYSNLIIYDFRRTRFEFSLAKTF
jgi:outer membrane protein